MLSLEIVTVRVAFIERAGDDRDGVVHQWCLAGSPEAQHIVAAESERGKTLGKTGCSSCCCWLVLSYRLKAYATQCFARRLANLAVPHFL